MRTDRTGASEQSPLSFGGFICFESVACSGVSRLQKGPLKGGKALEDAIIARFKGVARSFGGGLSPRAGP